MAEDTRAINCETCRRLISRSESVCPHCGAQRTGWRTAQTLRAWTANVSVTNGLFAANLLLYAVALLMTGSNILGFEGNVFTFLAPSWEVSDFLGTLEPDAVSKHGEVWRLLTCAFLHAGILHILFNLSWLRSIGPVLEEEFGPFRFATLYIGAALCGSLTCLAWGQAGLGASGAIFGLIGAGWSHGKRRGGVWGSEIRAQFGRWALSGVVFTLVMSSYVSVPGHAGGLVGGAALGWLLSPPQRRWTQAHRDPIWMALLGSALLVAVPLAFAADVAFGVLAPSRYSIPYLIGGSENLERWPLRSIDLAKIGAPDWTLDVPRDWERSHPSDHDVFVLDGGLGVNVSVELLRGSWPPGEFDRMLRWAASCKDDFKELRRDYGAGFAEGECPPQSDGGMRFFHVHRLDAQRVLLVRSSALSRIDVVAWRDLCARIGDSVRTSRAATESGK